MRKQWLMIRFMFFQLIKDSRRAAYAKAEYFRKHHIFKKFGKGGYWHPLNIPSFPERIEIGDNVTVCADVKFYEHDIVHRMWNGNPDYKGIPMKQFEDSILIGDNVVLCGNSIVLAGVTIGHDALVAAGSVVTKNVEPYAIVGGNPAKVIGDTRELYNRRLEQIKKV